MAISETIFFFYLSTHRLNISLLLSCIDSVGGQKWLFPLTRVVAINIGLVLPCSLWSGRHACKKIRLQNSQRLLSDWLRVCLWYILICSCWTCQPVRVVSTSAQHPTNSAVVRHPLVSTWRQVWPLHRLSAVGAFTNSVNVQQVFLPPQLTCILKM